MSKKSSASKFGFIHILSLSFLIIGLIFAINLMSQRTNLASQAKSQSEYVNTEYYLEKVINSSPITTDLDFKLQALLKHKSGSVVVNQENFEYQWSNEFPAHIDLSMTPVSSCTDKIKPPCPNDQLLIRTSTVGSTSSTNVKLSVIDKTSGEIVANTSFGVSVLQPEVYTTIDTISPDGGEIYSIGQTITIRWAMPSNPVDYYNLSYLYYEDGQLKSGYIGSTSGGAISFLWSIPQELKTKDAKVVVSAVKDGIVVATKYSSDYFTVRGL